MVISGDDAVDVDADPQGTVAQLLARALEVTGVQASPGHAGLQYRSIILHNDRPLASYGIRDGAALHLVTYPLDAAVKIKIVTEDSVMIVKVGPLTRFASVFTAVASRLALPSRGELRVFFDGIPVRDDDYVASLGIVDGDRLDAIRMQYGD